MVRQHTDKEYEAELRKIREQLLFMGAKVEEMLEDSMEALVQRDSGLANRTIDFDRKVNRQVAVELRPQADVRHGVERREPESVRPRALAEIVRLKRPRAGGPGRLLPRGRR